MRLIVFPGGEHAPCDETWVAELDAALDGGARGPAANAWRELRGDVRSLAPPVSDELMRRLERELAIPGAAAIAPAASAPAAARSSVSQRRRLAALRERMSPRRLGRPRMAAATALVAVLAVVAVLAGSGRLAGSAQPGRSASPQAVPRSSVAGPLRAAGSAPVRSAHGAAAGAAGDLETSAPVASQPAAAAPGRVQQLAASVSLAATPAEVQRISDGVARLAVREEGFVEDSHVQVQQHGSSEATLTLRLPSARLAAALAAIGRLAPVSAESQSLQDITSSYDSARQRLGDADAERAALLRALAKATTEAEIDSLRERLAQARGAIARARASLRTVSERASTAEVEVTVLGDARASSEGLTLRRGVHDAGRVLTVAAIVLLIAAAVLVPLALALVALVGAYRVWRRYARERALRV
jgi:hypothetical protein